MIKIKKKMLISNESLNRKVPYQMGENQKQNISNEWKTTVIFQT